MRPFCARTPFDVIFSPTEEECGGIVGLSLGRFVL